MTGQDRGDDDGGAESAPSEQPWYNRTPAVIGASVVGLAVIGILVLAVTYVSRQFDEPSQAPLNFVEPSFTATTTGSATPTTTATITSTSPPVTSDINPGSTTPSSPTSGSETPTSRIPPRTRENDDSGTRTPRRPRTNVTRTLYPMP